MAVNILLNIEWRLRFVIVLILLINDAICVPCVLRQFAAGSVCVCNMTYCDTLEFEEPNSQGKYVIISSSQDGLRFKVDSGEFQSFKAEKMYHNIYNSRKQITPQVMTMLHGKRTVVTEKLDLENELVINVDIKRRHQKIVGFGGAFTGAVSHNFDNIDKNLKLSLYKSYYSKSEGIGFNLIRIPIAGCDFDLSAWAYNELPLNDAKLSNFTKLDPRDLKLIEQIDELKSVSNNSDIKFMAAAWSSPPWMKTNDDWTGYSRLKPEYYQTWADYHIKYLELMSQQNLNFWALSTGNEPMNGVIGWLFVHFMSLGWTARTQGQWVGQNLGPSLRNSKFKHIKLFAGDDQRYTFPWWFSQMNSGHENATSYVDGFAVHWYWDFIAPPILLNEAHRLFPDKLIFNTEACLGDKPFDVHGPILGSWSRAEMYINSLMEDLQNNVNGWIDWNLILNEIGGPNYAQNYVESAVIVNTTSGTEAYKQPIFYILGHFSRLVTEDSVHIRVTKSNRDVEVIGFQRPDDKIVVIFYNKKPNQIRVTINDKRRGKILLTVPPKSIHSILYV